MSETSELLKRYRELDQQKERYAEVGDTEMLRSTLTEMIKVERKLEAKTFNS